MLHLELLRQEGVLCCQEVSTDERVLDETNEHGIALRTDDLMRRGHDFLCLGNTLLSLKSVDIHFICEGIELKKMDDAIAIFLLVSVFAGSVLLASSPGCERKAKLT